MKKIFWTALLVSAGLLSGQPSAPPDAGTPLLNTTLSLQLARARLLEQRYTDASSALRDAAGYLADYEALSPGPHDWEAGYIREQLSEYAGRTGWEPATMLDRIDYLWLPRVNQWYQKLTK